MYKSYKNLCYFIYLLICLSMVNLAGCQSNNNQEQPYWSSEVDIPSGTDIFSWSPDAREIVLIGETIAILNVTSGILEEWSGGVAGPATSVAWNPSGNLFLVTNYPDVTLFDRFVEHSVLLETHVQYRIFSSSSWSSDGVYLAYASSGGLPRSAITIWNTDPFLQIDTILPSMFQPILVDSFATGFTTVEWSMSYGSRILAAGWENVVIVWDVDLSRQIAMLHGHEDKIVAVVWIGESRIVSIDANGTINMWNISSSNLISTLSVPGGGITSISYSVQRGSLAVAGREGIWLWNINSSELTHVTDSSTTALEWSPDGTTLAILTENKLLFVQP